MQRLRKLLLRMFHDSMPSFFVASEVAKPDSSLSRKPRPALAFDLRPE